MTIKEQILLILEENKGRAISGEEMAERLNCTRAGVWKAIKALQTQGYEIEGINNKGYTLKTSADSLSQSFIANRISEAGFNIGVICEQEVDSTNEVAKRLAATVKDDVVVIAASQTAGKGRKGRSFYSPEGTGIYFSLLLHPTVPAAEAVNLTTLAVTAEAKALEKVTGIETQIKWVNDVWIRGKKISGILTEGSTSFEDGRMNYAIVGIGINLYEPEGGFPEDIRHIAGSVYEDNIQRENLRNLVASEVIIELLKYYKDFEQRTYLKEYEKRCFVIGKEVTIMSADHERLDDERVTVLGIDRDCHLHVLHADGHESYLSSGEISVKL